VSVNTLGNYHQLYYHATWATKERLPMIDSELRQPLHDFLKGKAVDMGGIVYAVGGVSEHVHLCLTIPADVAISKFIGQLKGSSAHWVNHIVKPGGSFGWQEGYGVFSENKGAINRIVAYIENQEQHHREKSIIQNWEIE
jgi:putative transposase